MAYAIDRLQRVELGRCGENLARRVAIDASTWLGRWPGARLEVLCHRPTESALYIPETLLDGAVLLWTVTAADTAFPGTGRGEVRAILGDVVVKSAVFDTVVTPALEGTAGDPPAAGTDWATDVIQAADRAEAASKQAVDAKLDAEAAANQAEENVRTALQEAKDSGEFDGAPGEDGYTPIKGVDYFDGAPGTSGVYLGKEAPTDETVNVWIDPEGNAYYPIATRETLGGVKVGDGLTVDETGVLGVKPEGEYELIEDIVLEEDSTINRTKEPDGTPYNFVKFKMRVVVPETNETSGYINALIFSNTQKCVIAYMSTQKKTKVISWCELWREGSTWDMQYVYSASNSAYSPLSKPTSPEYDKLYAPNEFGDAISQLYINVPLAAGTHVQIWGVRADA